MSKSALLKFLLLCFTESASSDSCRSIESISDHALFGYTYKLTSGIRLVSCAARCDADQSCYSFNYFAPTMTCELNNASRLADPGLFLRRSDALYLDKLKTYDGCESSPCGNNGTCATVSRKPGFECHCPADYSGETCAVCSPSPLGLSIPDENFNASSSLTPYAARNARLDSNSSWVNEGVKSDQFLQISFWPHSRLVTHVATQGNPDHDWWVMRYNLLYSTDGVTWSYYTESSRHGSRKEFIGNHDRNTLQKYELQPPVRAMYLRFFPRQWPFRQYIALRVEAYGCNQYS